MTTHRTQRRAWSCVALALVSGIIASGCGLDSGAGHGPTLPENKGSSARDAGQGDAGKGEEPETSVDACDIVSDDVAAQVLGVEIVRREPHGEPGGPSVSCIKGLQRSDDPKDFTYVNASVITGGAAAADKSVGQEGSEPVSGLGDRAVFLTSAGMLFIVDGDDLVQVQVVKSGVPGSEQQCVMVAKDVMSNLD